MFSKGREVYDLWWKGRVRPRQPSRGKGVEEGGRRQRDQGKNTMTSSPHLPLVDFGFPLAKPNCKPMGERAFGVAYMGPKTEHDGKGRRVDLEGKWKTSGTPR